MRILIGSTGFIGKNLQNFIHFDYLYNSDNLQDIQYAPDGCDLYLACLPAAKWMVNKNPGIDLENTINIFSTIKGKKYRNVYLFSTIDVYQDTPLFANEGTKPVFTSLGYGQNRYLFESILIDNLKYNRMKVIRLPGLFGNHLKKNILFDIKNNNELEKININSVYQWYNINRLEDDLNFIDELGMNIVNVFPEPVHTLDIIERYAPDHSIGFRGPLMVYNYRTLSAKNRYWYDKETSLSEIGEFLCR